MTRSKQEAKRSYDGLSGVYDCARGAVTNVVGLDLSSGMTRRARKRLERAGI